MPFDRTEPAAWWHGAEAAPPMPDEPEPWALVATAYGWEWRRAEAEPDAPRVAVRVKDRLHNAARGVTIVVASFTATECTGSDGAGIWYDVPDSAIGPAGSGKPWTLLPPVPAPDAPPAAGGGGGFGLHLLSAGGTRVVSFGGAGAHVRHEPAPARVLWTRFRAASAAYEKALQEGRGGACAMIAALRAADAVPDPRREAERRVVETARRFVRERSFFGAYEVDQVLKDALAALDGEGGG